MTISAGMWDVKTKLSEFVNQVVYGGQRVLITRNGKPVAALVSSDDLARLEHLEDDGAALTRRRAMEQALSDAHVWSKRLLEKSGGQQFPPLDELLREARQDDLA